MMPQIRTRDASNTLRTLQRIRARDGAGTLRTIQRVRARDANGILRTVYQAISSAVSPSSLSGTGATASVTTSGSATCTPTGGTAPYSYLWRGADYNSEGIYIISPTAATTAFRSTGMVSGDVFSGDFYCQVTDALGIVSTTGMVNVTLTRT